MSYFSQHPRARQALDVLNRQVQWSPILEQLISRYNDTPDDLQSTLKIEVEEVLMDLASMMDRMPKAPLGRMLARRLSGLECFRSRATRKRGKKGSNYWNPLEESFDEFNQKGHDVHFYNASDAYPASDIISKWSQENLQ